ncbi:MAG: alpha/beta hydrolase [Isosphaeraceae bacterium]|nr:alpha/beta hydrolase [Isosphaeraceae bacterium]
MPDSRIQTPIRFVLLIGSALQFAASISTADDVVLQNGLLLRGTLEKDNAIRMVSDELKRVFIRDSKIQSVTPSTPFTNLERFQIVQPLDVHAGAMPVYAIQIEAGQWNEKGRRSFSYVGPRSTKPVSMTQAMNDLGPYLVRFRGIDGFWVSQISTARVPKAVILGLLGRVDRTILNERQRVARFMLQAGWYDDARKEVESIASDFPEEKERTKEIIDAIEELRNRELRREISVLDRARRPLEVGRRLDQLKGRTLPVDVELELADFRKKRDERIAADKRLAESFREVGKAASAPVRGKFERVITEILEALAGAPDAVAGRLEAFSKSDGASSPDARLALAVSGWVVGADAAVTEVDGAQALVEARKQVQAFLVARDDAGRKVALDALELIERPVDASKPGASGKIDLETLARIIPLMPPPFHPEKLAPGKAVTHRVMDDENPEPTEYQLILPPEYHPLREYPTIVALHDGSGPRQAIDWWTEQAARHGYIVVAPDYRIRNQPAGYRYSTSEHAAIELSLRDARKRYAIDSDRVFLAGSMLGGNAAIDIGFAHPDLFAGVVSVAGLPARYVFSYKKNAERLPIYMALGDLAPGAREVVFEGLVKPMILDTYDITYAEYLRRGHEDLPEEAATILDWTKNYRRDPAPKSFEATTARAGDARFWGVVVQQHSEGRAIAPEAADPLGKNIRGAKISARVSALSNLLTVTASGVERLDVWVSPRTLDFKKKLEVRINGRTYFKGLVKPDLEPMLTDLRYRGDRKQLYGMKVTAGR